MKLELSGSARVQHFENPCFCEIHFPAMFCISAATHPRVVYYVVLEILLSHWQR